MDGWDSYQHQCAAVLARGHIQINRPLYTRSDNLGIALFLPKSLWCSWDGQMEYRTVSRHVSHLINKEQRIIQPVIIAQCVLVNFKEKLKSRASQLVIPRSHKTQQSRRSSSLEKGLAGVPAFFPYCDRDVRVRYHSQRVWGFSSLLTANTFCFSSDFGAIWFPSPFIFARPSSAACLRISGRVQFSVFSLAVMWPGSRQMFFSQGWHF